MAFPVPRIRAVGLLALGSSALLAWQQGLAEDIAWFKLTGLSGHVLVDYLSDGLDTNQIGGVVQAGPASQSQTNLREEVFLMTRSYVYHPNLLTLDIGGGPILQNTAVDQDGNRTSAGETLFNFTGRASLFKEKPIRGAFFYDHLNPTVTVAPGEVMVQESDRYGFDVALSGKGIKTPLNLGYIRTRTQGSGAGRVLDDDLQQVSASLNRSFGALGATSVNYQITGQSSSSGSLSLPIQSTTSSSQGLNVDTRLQFGGAVQYDLNHSLFLNRRRFTLAQGDLPGQGDTGMLLDLRARPSKQLNAFTSLRYSDDDQGSTSLKNRSWSGGLNWLPMAELETSQGLRAEQSDADQFALNARVLDGTARYKTPLPLGSLLASYGVRLEKRDQQAANPLVNVIDERVLLAGTAQAALSRPHVASGSIVVTNLTQSQTYVENLDYLVVVVGTETRLQRLVGGGILDGEEVLVDYTYDLGGTYASNQLDQTVGLNWNMARNLESYLRWSDSAPAITSGTSSFPLNPARTLLAGLRGEVMVGFELPLSLGGSYERETRSEVISPYKRQAADLFLQTTEPLLGLVNGRFTFRRTRVAYEFSVEDVDLTGYECRLWGRRRGLDLSAVASYERDLGGSLPRSRRDASINAQWRERKVTVTASLLFSNEFQGSFDRDHTTLRIVARRDL